LAAGIDECDPNEFVVFAETGAKLPARKRRRKGASERPRFVLANRAACRVDAARAHGARRIAERPVTMGEAPTRIEPQVRPTQ
jgi:hypothetical protein